MSQVSTNYRIDAFHNDNYDTWKMCLLKLTQMDVSTSFLNDDRRAIHGNACQFRKICTRNSNRKG